MQNDVRPLKSYSWAQTKTKVKRFLSSKETQALNMSKIQNLKPITFEKLINIKIQHFKWWPVYLSATDHTNSLYV